MMEQSGLLEDMFLLSRQAQAGGRFQRQGSDAPAVRLKQRLGWAIESHFHHIGLIGLFRKR
jgi:hypothetical protein